MPCLTSTSILFINDIDVEVDSNKKFQIEKRCMIYPWIWCVHFSIVLTGTSFVVETSDTKKSSFSYCQQLPSYKQHTLHLTCSAQTSLFKEDFFRETFDCYCWVSDLSSVASTRKLVADWVEVFRCPGWRIFKRLWHFLESLRVWVLGEPFLGFEVLPKHDEGKPPFKRWNF